MNELERRIADGLRRTAAGIAAENRLDDVVSAPGRTSLRRRTWRAPLSVAAAVAVAAGGIGVFNAADSDPPAASERTVPLALPGPQPNVDHWHAALGFQLCSDEPDLRVSGTLEEVDSNGELVNESFLRTGVHSHDDGLIHWHPYGVAASGERARLRVFFDNYGIDLNDDSLSVPSTLLVDPATALPGDDVEPFYDEDVTECDGRPATLQVVVWPDAADPATSVTYTEDFDEIPFDRDGMAITVAFVPDDVVVTMPPWSSDIAALSEQTGGDVDAGTPDSAAVATSALSSLGVSTSR